MDYIKKMGIFTNASLRPVEPERHIHLLAIFWLPEISTTNNPHPPRSPLHLPM